MPDKFLGQSDLSVHPIGLGCMGLSEFYGQANPTEAELLLKEAFELGINFFDTADVYGLGENEILLGKFINSLPDRVIIASKCGIIRKKEDPKARGICCSPSYIKKACEESLKRLNVDCIDLYYLHRMDHTVPIEESIHAMVELIKEGKIRSIGLSEASEECLLRAHSIHPITALQTEYSLWSRGPENRLLDLCKKLNISFIAYSPLGRGFLSGKIPPVDQLAKEDCRRYLPRFQKEAYEKNYIYVDVIKKMAMQKECSSAQIALAWVLAQGEHIIPIPGTKNPNYLRENFNSQFIQLSPEELNRLNTSLSQDCVTGSRYPSEMMKAYGLEQ